MVSSETLTKKHVYLGIDAGGTFTDFVLYKNSQWQIHKVLSTPDNPAKAILQGIQELNLTEQITNGNVYITHGSTVATNAALERKGAKTAYVTNKGFADLLTKGRQTRKELYNLTPAVPQAPVPTDLCFEVDCRRGSEAELIKPLDETEIQSLVDTLQGKGIEAVALNLLFSYLNEEEELRLEKALQDEFFVSRSSFVLPKYKEYERGMATWLNASLGPKVNHYMSFLRKELAGCPLSVMQSSGGTISAEQASKRAVSLLLSGPAGGLSAVKHIAKECHIEQLMSFDMGGTSTDVALMSGEFELTDEGRINDWPVAIPMLKMETIGAGGGSIAWADKGNMLHVGPQSAGSKPGPVCYGMGGKQPTVTDANLVLGRLQANQFLGGRMTLDYDAAFQAIEQLSKNLKVSAQELANGIIKLAEEHMVKALHSISIQKGHNPADFTLCCFGGAGGMHVCSLAESLGMKSALIPARSGVLSAFGMLTAAKQRQYTKTHIALLTEVEDSQLDSYFKELEEEGIAELREEAGEHCTIQVKRSLDLRYEGQSFTLNLPLSENIEAQFHLAHEKQYGHQTKAAVELVNVCTVLTVETKTPDTEHLSQTVKQDSQYAELPFTQERIAMYKRESLNEGTIISGPAIISEHVSTTWLKHGWQAEIDKFGHMHLSHTCLH